MHNRTMTRRPETRTGRRRSHKKSRAGCTQCKRRHIKCDEGRPACASCIAADLECPFLSDPQEIERRPPHRVVEQVSDVSQSLASPVDAEGGVDSDVNMVHLQLFHQFMADTSLTFVKTDENLRIYHRQITSMAFRHPYLMHQVLSLAAVHMSIQNPDRLESFKTLATSLQSKALAGLDEAIKAVDESNCLALLFFSHIVGVHSFCDVFVSRWDSFGDFLNSLLHAIHLLRGVQAIITPWWHVLMDTEMGQFMREGEENRIANEQLGTVIPHLHSLVDSADISPNSLHVYKGALMRLDTALHDTADRDKPRDDINIVFAWLVTAPREYTDLLAERRPEALVLLAYYSVVLHRRRKSWVVGMAGQRMFTMIRSHLGERWAHWLLWPSTQIFGTSDYATPTDSPPI